MKNIFMLQDPGFNPHFREFVSKISGIPEESLPDDENQIIINEHYFKNVYNSLFKDKFETFDDFVEALKDLEDGDIDDAIEIFVYPILD